MGVYDKVILIRDDARHTDVPQAACSHISLPLWRNSEAVIGYWLAHIHLVTFSVYRIVWRRKKPSNFYSGWPNFANRNLLKPQSDCRPSRLRSGKGHLPLIRTGKI
jgi:hypothetical protein